MTVADLIEKLKGANPEWRVITGPVSYIPDMTPGTEGELMPIAAAHGGHPIVTTAMMRDMILEGWPEYMVLGYDPDAAVMQHRFGDDDESDDPVN